MARKKTQPQADQHGEDQRPVHVHPVVGQGRARALRVVVLTLGAEASSILPALSAAGVESVVCTQAQRVEDALQREAFDALIVCPGEAQATPHSTLAWVARRRDLPAAVMALPGPTMELAGLCLRHNFADLIDTCCPAHELRRRLESAAKRTLLERRRRNQERRRRRDVDDMRAALERSRDALAEQVGGVCEQLAGSYRDLTGQLKTVALASELETLLRQELDVESLLRTTLEFTLRKVGPTNTAIFLPGSSGDWSLGAYVNYDCPRECAEEMLEKLCHVVAPGYEDRPGLHVLANAHALCASGEEPLPWMDDHALVIYSCVHEGECIAVVAAFRDRRTPWGEPAVTTLRLIGELFGKQLHRTIRTHHRHIRKAAWGEDEGMAA
ncbi:MAG: hypothetical protein U0637_14475 [Phycisphaerales bacterium]